MAKFANIQNSFISGEISPKLAGLTELAEYKNGLSEMTNFLSYPSGGAVRRSGSIYKQFPNTELSGGALYPFVISKTESYLVLMDATNTNSWATFGVQPPFQIYDSDGSLKTVNSLSTYQFPSGLDSKGFSIAQYGDFLIMAHSSGRVQPIVLQKNATGAAFDFTISLWQQAVNVPGYVNAGTMVPYEPINASVLTLTPSATAKNNPVTITASQPLFTNTEGNIIIRIRTSGQEGFAKLVTYISTTQRSGIVTGANLGGTTATTEWARQAWSNDLGWPKTVTIYQQRLVFGGSDTYPDTLWFSRLGNIFFFMQDKLAQDSSTDASGLRYFGDIADSDAFSVGIASSETNSLQWITTGDSLHFGTLGAEGLVKPIDGTFGPRSFDIQIRSTIGSSSVRPVRTGESTIYIDRSGRRVYDFKYSEANGGIRSRDISLLADHIIQHGGIGSSAQWNTLAYQSSEQTIWLLTNWSLVSLTYDPAREIISWAKHTLGGSYYTSDGARVHSIACIPSSDGTHDNLWLFTERTIAGIQKFYMEVIGTKFEAKFLNDASIFEGDKPWFSDCAIRITSATEISTLTGLGYLTFEEVNVVADGVYIGQFTVDISGNVDLGSNSGFNFIVGLPYTSTLETLDLEAGAIIGNSQILLKRIDQVLLKMYKSLGGKFGDGDTSYDLEYPEVPTLETYTGNIEDIEFDTTSDRKQRMKIETDEPYPMSVLALCMRGYTED